MSIRGALVARVVRRRRERRGLLQARRQGVHEDREYRDSTIGRNCRWGILHSIHCPGRDRPLRQSDRPWSPDDGKRDLAQLRALDPMPVLGDAGVVSSILNCILKLTSATPNADICSRCVLRAAELDPRGHKRAVDAHRLLCLAVAMRVRAAGRLRHRRHAHRRGRSDALPSVGAEYPERSRASPRAREAAAGQAQI